MRAALVFIQVLIILWPSAATAVRVGIFDISFYGIPELLPNQVTSDAVTTPHDLYSPHGAAVASLLLNPLYGGSRHGQLALMNTGIYFDDFKRGIELAIKLRVRLINVSLTLREPAIIDLINKAYQDHGIIFVVSAGNGAQRIGRELPSYYQGLQAIVASCLDMDGTLPDFAQLDQNVDVLAQCGRTNIPTLIKDAYRGIVEYPFGMTSAAAPQVGAWIIPWLERDAGLSLEKIKRLLAGGATRYYEFKGIRYPVLPMTEQVPLSSGLYF